MQLYHVTLKKGTLYVKYARKLILRINIVHLLMFLFLYFIHFSLIYYLSHTTNPMVRLVSRRQTLYLT